MIARAIFFAFSGEDPEAVRTDGFVAAMDDIHSSLSKYLAIYGRMEVRYLGDLKPSEYGMDAQFFAIGRDGVDGSDLGPLDLVQRMANRGKLGSHWINLSAVRDIKTSLKPSDEHVGLPIEADFGYLMNVSSAVASWVRYSQQIQLKDAA